MYFELRYLFYHFNNLKHGLLHCVRNDGRHGNRFNKFASGFIGAALNRHAFVQLKTKRTSE